MKYYQIGLDVEVTGVKNGIHQVDINLNQLKKDDRFEYFLKMFNSQNLNFWSDQDKIKDIKIPVIKANLLNKSNVTDVMGYTPNISFLNLMYSEKFLDIIQAFNIGNLSTFEALVDKVDSRYFLIFFETILIKDVKFEHSLVYTGHKILNDLKFFSFSNYDEYWHFFQKNPMARFEKIAISKEYLERDIIKLQGPPPFYSEKLIDFLLDCGVTGLKVDYNSSIKLEFV